MGSPNELVLTSNSLPKEWCDWKFEDGSDFRNWSPGSTGYLIASSQAASTLQVYGPGRSNAFVLAIDPSTSTIGEVDETDAIDVTNVRTSSPFPRSPFVCQDGRGKGGFQSFKFFA
jgi:myo-inositol-hexaphosphate 3-phosphohydrolase